MSSDDSDDEPLAVLAAKKSSNYEVEILPVSESKKRKKKVFKKSCDVTIELQNYKDDLSPVVVERPTDVWLYLKDLNPNGPYSCLLCSEWFINKTKIVIHYVVNHKKDFCGICRYFVPDREAWLAHLQFHTPWQCSQCPATFTTEAHLREHFSDEHKLVHCRLCHSRLIDGDEYHTHLFQKHSVTNVSCKNEEFIWEFEHQDFKFLCILCSKSNNLIQTFCNHYMAYHHLTLKCLAPLISGKNWNFPVKGADVTPEFVENQLKSFDKYGYLDLDKKPDRLVDLEGGGNETMEIITRDFQMEMVKEEIISEPEVEDEVEKKVEEPEPETYPDDDPSIDRNQITLTYRGDTDYDTTLTEMIVLQKCYYDYVHNTLNKICSNVMPRVSVINYGNADADIPVDIVCGLCKMNYPTLNPFIQHMIKMHSVKSMSTYSCRVCAATFDTFNELETHENNELGDFEDLWICQFCEKEFDNREQTRNHLTEHWDAIEYDNCFSPHLGFKCKYCPTLFWNETDREKHLAKVHFHKHKEDFYKCECCDETFSDKIWFVHHYLQKHTNKDVVPSGSYLLKCCLCCLVFQNVDEIRAHFNTKHPEAKRVFCSLDACKYKPFSHKKSFQLHLKAFHSAGNRRRDEIHKCQHCGKEFNSHRSCSAHTNQAHGAGRLACVLCKEILRTTDERKIHYLLRHPGRHPFQCRDCDKSFQYKSSLYLHRQEHAPNKQDYTCTYCGKVFKKRDSFREHVQIHEGPRHACSYCPMVFVQRSNMLRHERRHTGERPYACQYCPKTFSDKGACSSHTRTHQNMPAFPCMYCGQTFVQKSKLTYHIRKHTGENLETCPNCGKIFTSACSLREHMKTHEKKQILNPVKCPLCSKSYQDERYMMRHLRGTHTNTEHPCPICRKKLHSAASLRDHVVTHSECKAFQCKLCPKSYNVKRTMMRHLRRRHGLKSADANLAEFYARMDPRDCKLALDDETMNNIFGPPKRKSFDPLTYMSLSKRLRLDEPASERDAHSDIGADCVQVKIECEDVDNENGNELQPTDFVSVKIECTESTDNYEEDHE